MWFAIIAFMLIIMHPSGVYPVASLAIVEIFLLYRDLRLSKEKEGVINIIRRHFTLALPSFISAFALVFAYASIYPHMIKNLRFLDTPPTGIGYLSDLWSTFFGTGFFSWPITGMLFIGILFSIDKRSNVRLLLPIILLPALFISAQGISHYPWAYARFLVFTIPFVIILVSYGAWEVFQRSNSRSLSLSVSILFAMLWFTNLTDLFAKKDDYPWSSIREYVTSSSEPGDIVLSLEFNTGFHMDPRPDAEIYSRIRFDNLGPKMVDLAKNNNENLKVFLLIRGIITSEKRPAQQFGEIAVLTYQVNNYRQIMKDVREDLLYIINKSLPTDSMFAPIYSGILTANLRLGETDSDRIYFELRDAAKSRNPRSLHATETMLRIDAERVSKKWRQARSKKSSTQ